MVSSSSLLLKQLSICLIRFRSHEVSGMSQASHALVLFFVAVPPSWAGFRKRQQERQSDCLFTMYKHRNSSKLSPKSTADTFFFCRAQWLVHGMSGWKQSSGNTITYLMFLSSPNWITVTHFSVLPRSWWEFVNMRTSHPICDSLHWLPIITRVRHQVSLLALKCIHGNAPQHPGNFSPHTSTACSFF